MEFLNLTNSPKPGLGQHPMTDSSAASIHPLVPQAKDRTFQPDKSAMGLGYMFASLEELYWPHMYTVPGISLIAKLKFPPQTILRIPRLGPSKNLINLGASSVEVSECPRRP